MPSLKTVVFYLDIYNLNILSIGEKVCVYILARKERAIAFIENE